VQCIFVRGIGFGFSDGLRSAQNFLNSRFFIRLLSVLSVLSFLAFFIFFFGVVFFILFFVFEDRAAAGSGVGFDFLADEILLGVNDAVGEDRSFFVADGGFGSGGDIALGIDIGIGRFAQPFFFARRSPFPGFGRISGRTGEQPTGQSAAGAARSAGRSRLAGDAGLRFIGFGLRFEAFRFRDGSRSFDRRLTAILG
jgi:hypothetical protein